MQEKMKLFLISGYQVPQSHREHKVFIYKNKFFCILSALVGTLLFLPFASTAQLKVAKIFSDNMVLQRDQPVHIWGKAIPGKLVTVSFAKETRNTVVQNDSSWSIIFKKQKTNVAPQSVLIISDGEQIILNNILIGDIWVCIGQSNMEWPMMKEMHFKEEVTQANQPLIRLYNPWFVGKFGYYKPYTDSLASQLTTDFFYRPVPWQNCDSNAVKNMSAVGYYFGKKIAGQMNIPVGLIHLAIGGAPLETFISAQAMKNEPAFAGKFDGDWLKNNTLPVWARERGTQNIGGLINIPGDEYGNNHAFKPGFAFESGIKPILDLLITGILCYQGESNAQEIERVNEYAALFALMIEDYRKKWKQPQLPFYFVQLSSIDTVKYKGHLWPQFRDEQRKIMRQVPYSGMAVCSDIGFKDDVHPTNKKDVGERLARWALNKTYKRNIVPSGPLPSGAKYANGKIVMSFQYTARGLQTSDGLPVRGFSTDGKTESESTIQHNTIVMPAKEKPAFVYYAWKPFTDANLVNSELLPASTFKIKVK
jgi:sialate O-acetylesterase